MKYFNNKYVYYVLIFIAVFLFDFIIFQAFITQIISNNASVALGMVLIFCFFIVIPSVGAYYITIRHQQFKPTEKDKKIACKRIKVALGLISAIILILVVKDLTARKVDPFTYLPVTDKEFAKPLKILVTKKIGEEEYYFKETEQGTISLYQKQGEIREDDRFLFDAPFDANKVRDFWYDSASNTVFAIEERIYNGDRFKNTIEQIYKFSLDDTVKNKLQVLKILTKGFYSGGDKILDYFPKSDTLLIEGSGGDGCSGGDSIWTLTGITSETLKEFGMRCATFDKPRFIGYIDQYLYFAAFDKPQKVTYGEGALEGILKEIYKIDPKTRSITSIYRGTLNVIAVKLSKDKQTIVIIADQGRNFTLSLEQNSTIKEASSSAIMEMF